MKLTYDLYGAMGLGLLAARDHIEAVLGCSLVGRNSSYQGGDYYMFGSNDSENFILKINIDPFDDEPVEQNFSSYQILLYVNATNRPSDIAGALSRGGLFQLLRHEVF
jgi:hypothetical protein